MSASRPLIKLVLPSYMRISSDEQCLVMKVGAAIKYWDLAADFVPKCLEVAILTKGKGEGEVIEQLQRLLGLSPKLVWIAMEIRTAAEPLDNQLPRSPRFQAVYTESPTRDTVTSVAKTTKPRKKPTKPRKTPSATLSAAATEATALCESPGRKKLKAVASPGQK
jgi:hypothetical protein